MTTTVSSDSAASTQAEVSREIADISAAYQASGLEETQPRLDYARSTGQASGFRCVQSA